MNRFLFLAAVAVASSGMNKKLELEGGKRDIGNGVNHVAGSSNDNVQRCARCGLILIDNRGVSMPTGQKPRYFEPGQPVFKTSHSVSAFHEGTAPDCASNTRIAS